MNESTIQNTIFILAIFGALFALIGRLMVWRSAGKIGLGWFLIVFFLPGGDLIFLSRHWKRARTGVFTTMAGFLCLLPVIVLMAVKAEKADLRQRVLGIQSVAELSAQDREELVGMLRKDAADRIKSAATVSLRLHPRLVEWQKSLVARQKLIGPSNTPAELHFKQEVDSFKALGSYLRDLRNEESLLKGLPMLAAANVPDEQLLRLVARLRLAHISDDSTGEEETLEPSETP